MNIAYYLFIPIICDEWNCFLAHNVTNNSMKKYFYFSKIMDWYTRSPCDLKPLEASGNWYNTNLFLNFYFFIFQIEYMHKIFTKYLPGKKVGQKWLNFLQVVKIFPDFLCPNQYFSPKKNLSRFFFSVFNYYYHCFPIYLQNLLLPCFFYVLYISWLSKAVLTKFRNGSESKELKKITTMIEIVHS